MRGALLQLDPPVSGFSAAVAWLRDHDVPTKRIAGLFGITETHARQLAYRGQWQVRRSRISPVLENPLNPPADPFGPVADDLRRKIGIRPMMDAWTVRLSPEGRKRLDELEERVEHLGAAFWAGVRHGSGINRIHELLIEIGRPAHIRRVRILARVRYILAETYAHAGYSSSAIEQALTSLLLSRAAYHDSHDPYDLGQFARAALPAQRS